MLRFGLLTSRDRTRSKYEASMCMCARVFVCYSNTAVYTSSSFLLFNGSVVVVVVVVDSLIVAAPINCLFCVCIGVGSFSIWGSGWGTQRGQLQYLGLGSRSTSGSQSLAL